jgi:hypothetical protein
LTGEVARRRAHRRVGHLDQEDEVRLRRAVHGHVLAQFLEFLLNPRADCRIEHDAAAAQLYAAGIRSVSTRLSARRPERQRQADMAGDELGAAGVPIPVVGLGLAFTRSRAASERHGEPYRDAANVHSAIQIDSPKSCRQSSAAFIVRRW